MEKAFTEYYLSQAGNGFSSIYSGTPYQRGYGVGSWLGGLFHSIWPLFKKGAYAIGKEVLKGGVNVIDDIENKKKFKESFTQRSKEGMSNLKQKISNKINGNGIGSCVSSRKRKRQSPSVVQSKRIKKTTQKRSKNKTKKNKDIFEKLE